MASPLSSVSPSPGLCMLWGALMHAVGSHAHSGALMHAVGISYACSGAAGGTNSAFLRSPQFTSVWVNREACSPVSSV